MAEQRLVEELGRVEPVEYRQALGHDRAEILQLLGAQAVLAAVEQQRGGHVEALQGLHHHSRQQGEQDELPRTWRRAHVAVAIDPEQTLLDEGRQPAVDHLRQLLDLPADEQLGAQIGVQRFGKTQDLLAADPRAALEQARQQRRQGQDVHHVVAVVGHQDGVLLVQIEDVAQRVLLFGEQVEALHVRDQRVAVAFRQRGVRRVGHRTQQRLIEIENPRQGLLVQRLTAGGEHRQRHQVDRVDGRRLVEALGDALGQVVGGVVQPLRAIVRRIGLLAPAGLLLLEEFVELERLAEVYPDLPKALLEGADDLEDVEDRLLLLRRAAQFTQVGAAFQHALVADVDRHEEDRQA